MIEAKNVKNMRHLLDLLEKELAGRNVIRYMTGTKVINISTEQFFGQIRQCSCWLKAQGLVGKRIGIIGKNCCEWLVSFCAVLRAGSVAVLLDRELNSKMIGELTERVELDAIFYDRSTEEAVSQSMLPETIRKISIENNGSAFESKSQVTENDEIPFESEPKPEELACIFFTSGTTDKSKAVMMSGRGLIAGICSGINKWKFEALLAVLPFHHLAGFSTVLNALYLGAEVCLADELKYFFRYLECMKPDYVLLVPSMLRMLARKLQNGGENGRRLGWNLRIIHCGGAPFCSELLQMLLERKITVLQGFGASEAGGIGFLCEMTLERPDTIGKPPAEMEVRIEDGELLLRSEAVMMGYYGDEEATKEVLKDGWYATGDLCRADDEGYLYLTGRRKNLIILSNGENVSPEAIEAKLHACKEISEILVGVEQNLITATIFPCFPQDSSEKEKREIRDRIGKAVAQYNGQVPIYKQIQKVHFTEQTFAKTTAGKMIRRSVTGGDS